MCSIVQLLPGAMIDHDLLFNAMHNNEHGIGVLMKENGKIHVKKELPTKVDVDKFYKYLEDNQDVERWFHLRNCSSGDVSKNNVQPIQVYHSTKRDVFFMHNGTIYTQNIPEVQKKLVDVDVDDTKLSDSVRFAMSKIAPVLIRTKGADGIADITDPFVQEIIYSRWLQGHGRAVLISSDQPALLLNSAGWEKIKNKDGSEFLASNNDYFETLKRGTLFDQRRKEEAARNAVVPVGEINADTSVFKKNGRDIHQIQFPPFNDTLSLSENIVNILEEYDLYSPDGFIAMSFIDSSELKKLFKENLKDAVTMFVFLTAYLKDTTIQNQELVKLVAKGNKEIAELKLELSLNQGKSNASKSKTTNGPEAHVG